MRPAPLQSRREIAAIDLDQNPKMWDFCNFYPSGLDQTLLELRASPARVRKRRSE